MRKEVSMALLSAFALLAGCNHAGTIPQVPSQSNGIANGSTPTQTQSVTTIGNYTEYTLPAGVNPSDLARGPYNTIYVVPPGTFGVRAKVYQMAMSSGAIRTFTAPAPYENWGSAIISYNRSVTFTVVDHTIDEDGFAFLHVTPEGAFSVSGAQYFEDRSPTNFVLGSNGSLQYGWCIDPCAGGGGDVTNTRLPDPWVPEFVAWGPDGNIYAVATNQFCGPPDTSVFVISLAGAILHQFILPTGIAVCNGVPLGIATGADHNLWFTEPGLNRIGRMTTAGVIRQFSLPTLNAGPNKITAGFNGALFFTETKANKIGRITTTGSITEYRIPTANSGASALTPCDTTHCGTHGGVWFTETTANKIGRFNSPI